MGKLTVKFNNPDLPKGAEIDVVGVGPVKNGGQLSIDQDTQDRYERENGVTLSDALKENPNFNIAPDETPGEKRAAKAANDLGVPEPDEGSDQ